MHDHTHISAVIHLIFESFIFMQIQNSKQFSNHVLLLPPLALHTTTHTAPRTILSCPIVWACSDVQIAFRCARSPKFFKNSKTCLQMKPDKIIEDVIDSYFSFTKKLRCGLWSLCTDEINNGLSHHAIVSGYGHSCVSFEIIFLSHNFNAIHFELLRLCQ